MTSELPKIGPEPPKDHEKYKKSIEIYPGQGGEMSINDIPKTDVYYFWISEGSDEILIDKLHPSTMIIHIAIHIRNIRIGISSINITRSRISTSIPGNRYRLH